MLAPSILLVSLSITPLFEKSSMIENKQYSVIASLYDHKELWSDKIRSSSSNKIITNTDTFFDLPEILDRLEDKSLDR